MFLNESIELFDITGFKRLRLGLQRFTGLHILEDDRSFERKCHFCTVEQMKNDYLMLAMPEMLECGEYL